MRYLVGGILNFSLPRDMVGTAAPKVPFAARMRRLVFCGWRITVRDLTHKSVRTNISPADPDFPVPVCVSSKRPNQTVITSVIGSNVPYPVHCGSVESAPTKWVSVALPSPPVHVTPPTGAFRFPVAAFNRTCFEIFSHFRPFLGLDWLGPRPVLTHRFGPFILSCFGF